METIVVPPKPLKSVDAAALLLQRVRSGHYQLRGLPSERRLAAELGISHMWARKVVQSLIEKGVLERRENGRLVQVERHQERRPMHIAFVMPAFSFQLALEIQYQLSEILAESGGIVRPVTYTQPSDPVIFEALEGDFDGLFVILPIDAPRLLVERLARDHKRVVMLWADLSHLGILSIVTGPARFVGKGLDHLMNLGHQRIDCFNTLPIDPIVNDRIAHWRLGLEQRGLKGELHNHPTRPFQCSITAAYHEFKAMAQRGLESKAYFCVTTEIARGILRACHEMGITVGKDVSICGFSELSVARLAVPSLTAVETADVRPFLRMGFEWIKSGGRGWKRPLRLEPDDVRMFIGESTGAPSP